MEEWEAAAKRLNMDVHDLREQVRLADEIIEEILAEEAAAKGSPREDLPSLPEQARTIPNRERPMEGRCGPRSVPPLLEEREPRVRRSHGPRAVAILHRDSSSSFGLRDSQDHITLSSEYTGADRRFWFIWPGLDRRR